MNNISILILIMLPMGAYLSVIYNKLTVKAAIIGLILALIIYRGASFAGISMMAAFFVTAVLATRVRINFKKKLHLADHAHGKRDLKQVLANAGLAGVFGCMIIVFPENVSIFGIMMAGSFAAATSDTLSSELGNAFGSRFFDLRTFNKGHRGENGVISFEGSLAGILGSSLIAAIYCFSTDNWKFFTIILFAGIVGNLADSFLGAGPERNGRMSNNLVNFLNTLVGAVCAYVLSGRI